MSQFEEFKKKLEEVYSERKKEEDKIYNFILDMEDNKNLLNAELKEDNNNIAYDSYGSEDSKLEFVKFSGTRQSHNGEVG